VEDQIYERLTEDAEDIAVRAQPTLSGPKLKRDGQNSTTILSDVVSFGSRARNDEHRRIIRSEVFEMTRASLQAVWDQCHFEDRGDGLLVVVPPSIPTAKILEYLLLALPVALKRHNRTYAEGAQIQLRIALDVGPVTSDELGVSGQVVVNTARLIEARPFKQAMDTRNASLGVIVSDSVYQSVVNQVGYPSDPADYDQIEVDVKQTHLRAWMHLFDPQSPEVIARAAS
jgi:class 3 adenylate cyclase